MCNNFYDDNIMDCDYDYDMHSLEPFMSQPECMPMERCVPVEGCIPNMRLATAYVPFQYLCEVFNPQEGLAHGTIFPDLVSPYKSIKHHLRKEED